MIVLQNISKYYYAETAVTQALRKINLEFSVGEFVAITGESGSGKSTLLNIISGMDSFDEGELYFDGEETFQYDEQDWEKFRRNQIGFVFQDYKLIGAYSALENIKSALLIMGVPEEEARERATKYLKQVGMEGLENQKTAELSSGQKQRLSIARALAKETSIIIADEPTGNLDSETGDQIMQLLKKISKDKLVLMVTHNYDQAEPYVTRKIRLHDGEVVVDISVNQEQGREKLVQEKVLREENVSLEQDNTHKRTEKRKQRRIASYFAKRNRKDQAGRAMLFRIFLLFTAVVSFVFIGQLYERADDTSTKDYDREIFYHKEDNRLCVRRKDGKKISDKDISRINGMRNVTMTDKYDYVNDIVYYTQEGKDYKLVHGMEDSSEPIMAEGDEYAFDEEEPGEEYIMEGVKFLKKNKFMKSTTCITKSQLSQGRMPQNRNEIVVGKEAGKKQLNTKKDIYFTEENTIGEANYYHNTFKIVGVLKETTSQIYFHEDFCQMLSAPLDGDQVTIHFLFSDRENRYMGRDQFYLVIGKGLKDNQFRAAKNYMVPPVDMSELSYNVEDVMVGGCEFTYCINTERKGIPSVNKKMDGTKVEMVGREDLSTQGGNYVEVSENTFKKYFSRDSLQASVYIKNYTKTDKVIRALKKAGYEAVSTYRISSHSYNDEKVMDRLVFMAISFGILLVLILVEILILRSLMKIKINDFFVLKSMGMEMGMIKRISIYEMTGYCGETIVVTILLMLLLNLFRIPFLNSMMIYYGVWAYLTFFLYNFLLEYVTVQAFNHLLEGRMKA